MTHENNNVQHKKSLIVLAKSKDIKTIINITNNLEYCEQESQKPAIRNNGIQDVKVDIKQLDGERTII